MSVPPPLFEALDEIGAVVETASHLLVFLDFDGTLAPIADTPDAARLPDKTRGFLKTLARRVDCTVSIVSGRAVADVRRRVGVAGLVYAGNHGLEIAGGGLHFDEATAIGARGEVARAVATLEARLCHVPGTFVEAKGLTASVHYRVVSPGHWDEVERVVHGVVPEDHPDLVITAGKMVWEVRPRVGWNKGTAVRWIRERLGLRGAATFYLGDDRTDEDAFAEVGRVVTARVGTARPTRAGYRLADADEVAEFLQWLSRAVRFADAPNAT